jgi:UDPglucose--hexose-1-phosphate uridylyltransferase
LPEFDQWLTKASPPVDAFGRAVDADGQRSESTDMTWEQRYHPLRDEWVVVAGHRQHRPWQGELQGERVVALPSYVADCYLCPGNARVHGARNPVYESVFAFDNDHPCVALDAPATERVLSGEAGVHVHVARRAEGVSRVVCYSPRHDLTLAQLSVLQIVELFQVWCAEYRALAALPSTAHVLVFENKGEAVGVSNPHPHCQIYATNFVFKTIETELGACQAHRARTGRILFRDIIAAELADGRRLLAESDGAVAFVPYFARYAYEAYVAPKQTYANIAELPEAELVDLADALKQVLVRYDNLWQLEFPYVMALHQAPTRSNDPSFHFHIELHPPLRRPHLLKHLAGPEIGGGSFISDTSPEVTAAELRAVSPVHYKER